MSSPSLSLLLSGCLCSQNGNAAVQSVAGFGYRQWHATRRRALSSVAPEGIGSVPRSLWCSFAATAVVLGFVVVVVVFASVASFSVKQNENRVLQKPPSPHPWGSYYSRFIFCLLLVETVALNARVW